MTFHGPAEKLRRPFIFSDFYRFTRLEGRICFLKILKKIQKKFGSSKKVCTFAVPLLESGTFYESSLTRLKGSKQVQASTENEEYESVNSQN